LHLFIIACHLAFAPEPAVVWHRSFASLRSRYPPAFRFLENHAQVPLEPVVEFGAGLIAALDVEFVGSPANSFFQGKCFDWGNLSPCGCRHGITSGDERITDGVRSEASLIKQNPGHAVAGWSGQCGSRIWPAACRWIGRVVPNIRGFVFWLGSAALRPSLARCGTFKAVASRYSQAPATVPTRTSTSPTARPSPGGISWGAYLCYERD
jgi:hypothetical protein